MIRRLLLVPASLALTAGVLAGCGGSDPEPTPATSASAEPDASAPANPTASPTVQFDMDEVMAALAADLEKARTAIEAGDDPTEAQLAGDFELAEGNYITALNQASPTEYSVCLAHLQTQAWTHYDTKSDEVTSGRSGTCPM